VELRTEQKWEAGDINPPLTTRVRIQEVFGCKLEVLLDQTKCAAGSSAKS
jgi:DNA-binding XRE family transcriptional regulator